MEQFSLTSLFINNFSLNSNSFKVSYQESNGSVLHGLVKQITPEHFEVLVQEKDVIIQCTTDKHGVLSCKLNSHGNPAWVDGISDEVAKELKRR